MFRKWISLKKNLIFSLNKRVCSKRKISCQWVIKLKSIKKESKTEDTERWLIRNNRDKHQPFLCH
jgi:hypothetical protein